MTHVLGLKPVADGAGRGRLVQVPVYNRVNHHHRLGPDREQGHRVVGTVVGDKGPVTAPVRTPAQRPHRRPHLHRYSVFLQAQAGHPLAGQLLQ